MIILGVDYGRAKIGLAIAEGPGGLAAPLRVVKVTSFEEALEKVEAVVQVEKVEQVVVGVSEGEMGEEQEKFAAGLATTIAVPVETWDEGLTTQDAQALAIATGRGPKKRRALEDAYAATLVLQSYLDEYDRQEGSRSD